MSRKKTFVFSNLATSLDGKIAPVDRGDCALGTPADRREMQRLRKKADAVLFGASTLRVFQKFCGVKNAKKQPANVVISSTLKGISPNWAFFQNSNERKIVLVGPKAKPSVIRKFDGLCEIYVLDSIGSKSSMAEEAVELLSSLGIKRLLVEGGGGMMWEFASQNLIDEYHITHTPRILGGTEAPTLVDGPGLPSHATLNLKLKSCKRVKDELYLVYQKQTRRGCP